MKRFTATILGVICVSATSYAQSYHSDVTRPLPASITGQLSTVPTVAIPNTGYTPAVAYTQAPQPQPQPQAPVAGIPSSGCNTCSQPSMVPIPERRCERQCCHRPAWERIRGWFGVSSHQPCMNSGNCVQFGYPRDVVIPQSMRSCGMTGGYNTCSPLSGPCGARSFPSNEPSLFSRLGSIFSIGNRGCGSGGCNSGGCGHGGCCGHNLCSKCRYTKGAMPGGSPYLGSFQVTQSVGMTSALNSSNAAPVVHKFADPYNAGTGGSMLYPGVPAPAAPTPSKPMLPPMSYSPPAGTTYPSYGPNPLVQRPFTNP